MTPAGQTETPQLSILILGPPVVTRKGQLIRINRREQRAGLFFLAARMEPVSRDEICSIFWPDDSESAARKKLREGLSRLRSALIDPDLLITNNDFVSLDPNRVYVDAREYTNIVTPLLNSSEFNATGIMPEWMYGQLRKAADLCRGHQLLQDVSLHSSAGFDSWVSINNQSFAFSHEKILERLAEHCIALGNIDEAILWLGKISAFDHLNTDINYLMINCLRERRRFKEALDYLSYLEGAYQANLPGGFPEILGEMKKRVMRESLETRKDPQTEWPRDITDKTPFVGRSDLLLRLNNAYQRKGLVHISGEAGSGKTRLLQEFYSRLDYTPRLLFCSGKPMISSTPYAPIVEGLNQLVTEKEWLSLPDEIKTNLHSLYPALKFSEKRLSPIIIDSLPESPLIRIHNALYSLLKILAEKKPLLMVIEIAQWCDEATLQFLGFLNEQQFFKTYGLLILSSRTEERNPVLEAYLDQSVLTSNLERMTLEPFTLEETSQLISIVLGKSVSEDLSKKIQTQTGGNPYLLIETLKALDLFNMDFSTFSAADHFPIPASIRAIVNGKARALSDLAREVLSSAAVLGQSFLPQVLEKMVDLEFEPLHSALEELTQNGILSVSRLQTAGAYEFPHDQFREVILEELSPVRKRGLHLAAAQALLEVKGEAADQGSTFAWHYEQAGEYAKAFSAWCMAGRYSRACFSKADAYAAYQRAFDLFSALPAKEASGLLRQLLLEWGNYAYDLQDNITCKKLYTAGLEFGEARQDPQLIGISISGLGRVAEMTNDMDEGIELQKRALFFLCKTDANAEKLETYARLALLYELKSEYKKAKETYLTGMEIEINFSDKLLLDASVNLKSHFSILSSMMGFPSQAESIADQAANESKLINRLSGRVHAYTALAIAQYYEGKYQRSLQNAFLVYKLAEQLNLAWWASLLDILIARDYLVMGQLDESWYHLHHAVEKRDPALVQKTTAHHFVIKGDILRLLGDYSAAEEQYRLGAQPPLADLQSLESLYSLGLSLCQRDELVEGVKIVTEANDKAGALGLESISIPGKIVQSAIQNPTTDEDGFISETAPLVSVLMERGFGAESLTATFIAASLALRRGKSARAKDLFIQAAEGSKKINHRWYELWAVSALASMGNVDSLESQQYLERKKSILNEMSAHALKMPLATLIKKLSKTI